MASWAAAVHQRKGPPVGADGPTSGVPIAWRGSGGAIGNGVQPPCTRPAGGPTIRWCRCRGSVCDRCRFTSVTERPRRPDRYGPALPRNQPPGDGAQTVCGWRVCRLTPESGSGRCSLRAGGHHALSCLPYDVFDADLDERRSNGRPSSVRLSRVLCE
jgi:hypothetical protein